MSRALDGFGSMAQKLSLSRLRGGEGSGGEGRKGGVAEWRGGAEGRSGGERGQHAPWKTGKSHRAAWIAAKRISFSHFGNQSDQILDWAGLNFSHSRGNTPRRGRNTSVHRTKMDNQQAQYGRGGVNMHANGINAHNKLLAV